MLKNPVYIHGWAFSSKVFKNFRGIKIDLPSHGKNKRRYESFYKTVEEIALSLPSKHDIVGWSLGGSVAILLAHMFPQKVNRLILIGTSPFFKLAWNESNLRAFRMLIKRKGLKAFRDMVIKGFEDYADVEGCMKMLDDYINLDLRDMVPLIDKEIFIVQGVTDNIVPVKEAYKLYNLSRRAKLIILEGNHLPVRDEGSLISSLFKVRKNL